jgi:hypothetical protein
MEVSGQLLAPADLLPRERAIGSHLTGGWVGSRAVLDAVVKRRILSPRRESNPELRSSSLTRDICDTPEETRSAVYISFIHRNPVMTQPYTTNSYEPTNQLNGVESFLKTINVARIAKKFLLSN